MYDFIAFKAHYDFDGSINFTSIGSKTIAVDNKNPYLFGNPDNVLKTADKFDNESLFNSCEDLIKLSDEQKRAVVFDNNKNLVILAGAGSGKTRTLSARYLYLHFVKNVQLNRLLLITFTRRARTDMQEKTIKLYKKILNDPNAETSSIRAKTIDSFYRYLISTFYSEMGFSRKPTFRLDYKDKNAYKKIICDLILKNQMSGSLFKNDVVNVDSNFLRVLDSYMRGGKTLNSSYDSLAKLSIAWQLDHNEIYTFSAATSILLDALNKNNELVHKINSIFDYVLIDEFQDINDVQDSVFRFMYSDPEVHFTFVGDDDQSIYFWRGSNNEIIKNIADRNDTDKLYLNTNYRNNPFIVKAGNCILRKINARAKDSMEINAFQKTGSKIRVVNLNNEYSKLTSEIQSLIDAGVKPGKIAILSRLSVSKPNEANKKPLDYVIDALIAASIPYDVKAQESEYDIIYDVFKYLLSGLSNSESVYSIALQIIEDMRTDNIAKNSEFATLTPSLLNGIVFNDAIADPAKFTQKTRDFLKTLCELKILLENCYECDLEELLKRYAIFASKKLLLSDQNIAMELPIMKKLLSYFVNNPLKWPSSGLKISNLFISFEENMDLVTDSDDIDIDDMETVKVSTIHNFKGPEFDVVFVTGLNAGQFPDTSKLLRERQERESELKLLVDSSRKLQEKIRPSLICKFNSLVQKKSFICHSQKFVNAFNKFLGYICKEANYSSCINSVTLENYEQAYAAFIDVFVTKLKEAIGANAEEIDALQLRFNRDVERQSLKLSSDDLEKLMEKKLSDLMKQKEPLLEKKVLYERTLKQIEEDILEAKELLNLTSVALDCLKNISKISEMENYVSLLDYELAKKIEEERKLFYVAITRASNLLYLVYSAQNDDIAYQSEFIVDIPESYRMKYNIKTIEERRKVHESIGKNENVCHELNDMESNGKDLETELQKPFLSKSYKEYLKKCEIQFYNEHPLFGVLAGKAREYFVNALYYFFLQDYLGINFTAEYLLNMQYSAKEFLNTMTGKDASFPVITKEIEVGVVNKICLAMEGCITIPPTHKEIEKLLCNKSDSWKSDLRSIGIIHYFVRSCYFNSLTREYKNKFKYPYMQNSPDKFIKAVIDINNYRSSFLNNHKPIWNGDPKEDVLEFYSTIILNFYTEKEALGLAKTSKI